MKKLSLTGIAAALLVGTFYTFVFLMTDNIDNSDVAVIQYDTYSGESSETKSSNSESDFSEVNFISDSEYDLDTSENEMTSTLPAQGSAHYLAGNIKTTAETDLPKLPETTVTKAYAIVSATTTAPVTTTTAATTTIATTTSVTTTSATTTSATTTSAATTAQTTTPVIKTTVQTTLPPSSNYNETLTVKVNGSTYSSGGYDLICKVVAAEMPTYFHEEAIKAQAVATYSYIKYSNQKGIYPSVSIKSSVPQKVSDAVKSVYGLAVYYNGSIAQTVYCSSSGGYTSSAKDVWGNYIPYLVSVQSEYDNNDSNYGVKKTFSEDTVRSILTNAGFSLSDNPQNWFTLLPAEQGGLLDGGYIGNLLIDGKSTYKGGKAITGRALREDIFSFQLKSSKFDVSYSSGTFTFTTYGYGHGVGMSQNGANLYASMGGYDFRQILEHYYTGITIQ